jgi:hypothetical protein
LGCAWGERAEGSVLWWRYISPSIYYEEIAVVAAVVDPVGLAGTTRILSCPGMERRAVVVVVIFEK